MKLNVRFFKLRRDETGAVTVDWVVLGGVLVALAIGVTSSINVATSNTTNTIGSYIQQQSDGLE